MITFLIYAHAGKVSESIRDGSIFWADFGIASDRKIMRMMVSRGALQLNVVSDPQ
jgi:hypothetical protein